MVSALSQDRCLSIETAGIHDLDQIMAIEEASFSAPWSRKAFEAELLGNDFSTILMASKRVPGENRHEVIGYVCVWIVFEELRFMNLAVSPNARRQGIGRLLVLHAVNLGLSKDTKRALLEVRESNQAARTLYSCIGFAMYGKRRAYYTNQVEDAILMSRDLVSFQSV